MNSGIIGSGLLGLEKNGGLAINVQDQVSDVVDLLLHIEGGSGSLLAVDANVDDTVVTLTGGHGVSIGDTLCFKENLRFYQGVVLNVSVNDVTLDTPLDYAFTISADVCYGNSNLNVDGSVIPAIAHLKPTPGTKWDIVRILFSIDDNNTMDTATFGGIAGGLTNGIVMRVKNGLNKNIFNVKSNGEFAERAYDVAYADKAPAGLFGFTCRRTFGGQSKNGVVIRLDSASDDELQLIIRDNLTSLVKFRAIAQGHVVQN